MYPSFIHHILAMIPLLPFTPPFPHPSPLAPSSFDPLVFPPPLTPDSQPPLLTIHPILAPSIPIPFQLPYTGFFALRQCCSLRLASLFPSPPTYTISPLCNHSTHPTRPTRPLPRARTLITPTPNNRSRARGFALGRYRPSRLFTTHVSLVILTPSPFTLFTREGERIIRYVPLR